MAEAVPGTKRRALFRLEFGGTSGWGHLVRSGVLAAELRRGGWSCVLWTGSDTYVVPGELIEPFDRVLPFIPECSVLPLVCTALVVDHYGTDDATLRAWRAGFSGMLLVLDDEGIRRLDAARLVLNARPGLAVSPYAPGVRCLLGERFALLRSGLRTSIAPSAELPADTVPVLVMMGGTDPGGGTAGALEALADVDADGITPIVVRPGTRQPMGAEAVAWKRFRTGVWLDGIDASLLAGWARLCQFAVSAAGGTLYELALLRLPFVSIVVADNQGAFADQVAARWGMPRVASGIDLRAELAAAVRGMQRRLAAGDPTLQAGFTAVDGRGAERVARALAE